MEGLGDKVDLILDAGPCTRGIESTVIDCTVTPPRILRPGPLSRAELEAAVGGPVARPDDAAAGSAGGHVAARSPGTGRRHYAPATPLELPADPVARVAELLAAGQRVGWLVRAASVDPPLAGHRELVVVPMPADPAGYARLLYATLHALDQRQLDRIIVDRPPADDAWQAVLDRLTRAAAG